jgi:hypothetical protein
MAILEVTIKFQYEISNDPEYRARLYEAETAEECAAVDAENSAGVLFEWAQDGFGTELSHTIKVVSE